MCGAGMSVVLGAACVLASAEGHWTARQNFVDYAIPDARSRIVETGDVMACGVMSMFFGLGGCEPENVTLLLDTSPASLCAPEGLTGKVLFYPQDFWERVQSLDQGTRAEARREYACVDWASGRFDADKVGRVNARVAFLVARGARGALWGPPKRFSQGGMSKHRALPSFERGGLLYYDDLYEDRSAEGAGTLLLECAVPLAVSQRSVLASATSCELELVCQDLPFAAMFKSAAYAAVFRYGLGLLFCALAAYGVYLALTTGARDAGQGERLFILLNNIVSCGAFGIWAFSICGWYSQPTLTSQVREGYVVAFFAQVMCSIMLITIRWNSVLEADGLGVQRFYRVQHTAVALSYAAAVVFELCIIFGAVHLIDVQVAVSAIYLLWTGTAAAFYLRIATRFYRRLEQLTLSSEGDARVLSAGQLLLAMQIRAILKDVVMTGAILGATCVSIALCALPQLFQPYGWFSIWFFNFACRWMLSLCAMHLASPSRHRVGPARARTLSKTTLTPLTRDSSAIVPSGLRTPPTATSSAIVPSGLRTTPTATLRSETSRSNSQ